jgi:hypothetical protein
VVSLSLVVLALVIIIVFPAGGRVCSSAVDSQVVAKVIMSAASVSLRKAALHSASSSRMHCVLQLLRSAHTAACSQDCTVANAVRSPNSAQVSITADATIITADLMQPA